MLGSRSKEREIHDVHGCLHKACNDAVRRDLITRKPLDAADPPRASGNRCTEKQAWSAERLAALEDRM